MASRFTVDDLIDLAPPPEWRIDAGSPGAWDGVEQTLGTALPDDYKLIINVYGSGNFNDLFFLFNPFDSHGESGNLVNQALRRDCFGLSSLDYYEEIRSISPASCPFATFPEPGGLLPMGGDMNGGFAFWLMEGKPDDWPLVLYPDWSQIERHPMHLVDFLVLWLSGRLPDCFDGVGQHFVNRTDPVFQNGYRGPDREVRL
jgi:SMI1-KNR4 cell-wall